MVINQIMNKKSKEPTEDGFYRIILDAIPSPVFVAQEDVKIVDYNTAASGMLGETPSLIIRKRAGEALHCLHSSEVPEGCGRAPHCRDCIIRNSVNESLKGKKLIRQKTRMEIVREGKTDEAFFLVTTVPFDFHREKLVLIILEDISELVALKSFLPICVHCKKIRNDQEYWQNVEAYFKSHLDINFSHGLCPDCIKKLYPDY